MTGAIATTTDVSGVNEAPADEGWQRGELTSELIRTANVLRGHLERAVLNEFGLRWTAFDILRLICRSHDQGMETRLVAAALGISKATVTATAARLRALGLISRHTQLTDHRRAVLTPTAAGSDLTSRIRQKVMAEEARVLRRSGPPMDVRAAAVLRRIADPSPPGDQAG